MKSILRMMPAVGLLILLTGILLASDWSRRTPTRPALIPIAIMKYSSRPTLNEGVDGIIEALAARGFRHGENIAITQYNAENDIGTANIIAKQITDGRFNMVITVSTPGLQTVAGANRDGRAAHIFGIVTDPAGAGVGISREDPLGHPAWLAGIGTFQPVEKTFRLMREVRPGLKKVGTVWCPGEACSTACMQIARRISSELGIKLVEVTVDNSAGVREATEALIAKGIEVIWIGGDNTVEVAVNAAITVANTAGIPVITNNLEHSELGALLTLGANYREVGRRTGELAAEVLNGRSPATIRIEDVAPPRLFVNTDALRFVPGWTIPEVVRARAAAVFTDGKMLPQDNAASPVAQSAASPVR